MEHTFFWPVLFIRSLKCTLCRLKRTTFEGLESTTSTSKPDIKRHSRRYTQGSKAKSGSLPKAPDKTKIYFKFGLEILKHRSGILSVDEASGEPYERIVIKRKLLH